MNNKEINFNNYPADDGKSGLFFGDIAYNKKVYSEFIVVLFDLLEKY